MNGWFLLLAAIAPVVFMLHFVYVRDKYEREPMGRVLLVFFVSFLTVIPAAIVEGLLLSDSSNLFTIALSVWAVIALSEEGIKYIALRLLAVNHPSFNEVYDGILYAVAASLGFATVENLTYVLLSGEEGLLIAVLRAVLAVPGHALWGVMMGFYVGLAKFEQNRARKLALVWRGLLIAIFWHGLYDFFAFGTEVVGNELALLFGLGVIAVIIINWIIAVRMIRKAQSLSVFKRPSLLTNPVLAMSRRFKFCHRCGLGQAPANHFCVRCGYQFPP